MYCLLYRYSIFLILSGAQCVLSMYCYFMKLVCIIKRSKTWVSTLLSIDFGPSSWFNGFPRWCSLRKRKKLREKDNGAKIRKIFEIKIFVRKSISTISKNVGFSRICSFFLNIVFWLAVQDEEGRLVISKIRDRLYLITGLEMIYRT